MCAEPVGVFPRSAYGDRQQLFSALEAAFDVVFVPREFGEWSGLGGAVAFADSPEVVAELRGQGIESLVAPLTNHDQDRSGRKCSVRFTNARAVDERLRGRSLVELHCSVAPLMTMQGEVVLAESSDGPLWTATEDSPRMHRVAIAPSELQESAGRLKDHLTFGRFAGLIPLVHLLREITGFKRWERPPARASFILDDPNLHWPTYGYIRYAQLADHAAEHSYHVGIAMLPLDASIVHPGAVRFFRDRPQLSLLIHGNDHVRRELDRPKEHADPLAVAAQALRRVAAFESRTRTAVCRLIVPPHDDYLGSPDGSWCPQAGACSEEMMAALRRSGFEGVCYWGPSRTTSSHQLVGWNPADTHLGGGLPGFHRMTFDAPMDELVLRSFLDQPLILFGHHEDLAGDLEALADAAARVNALGPVTWGSSSAVARSNYFTRLVGDCFHVRAFANRIQIQPDLGATQVLVEPTSSIQGDQGTVEVVKPGGIVAGSAPVGEPVALPTPGSLDLHLVGPGRVDPREVPAPPWRPWPLVRRCLTEGRDRVQPIAGRVRGALSR